MLLEPKDKVYALNSSNKLELKLNNKGEKFNVTGLNSPILVSFKISFFPVGGNRKHHSRR